MSLLYYLFIAVVLFIASALQSAIGFAFALLATPLLVFAGMPLTNTVALISTCSLLQSGFGLLKLREFVPWRLSLWATAVRVASLVVGIYLLKKLSTSGAAQIRLVLGCIICGMVFLQLLLRPEPKKSRHWLWGLLAFGGSGVFSGLSGMGGPPMVIWVMAHDWCNEKSRAFLFSVFVMAIPIQLGMLYLSFASSTSRSLLLALIMTPIVYCGTALGLKIGARFSKEKLRFLVYATLLLIGLGAIMPSLLKQ